MTEVDDPVAEATPIEHVTISDENRSSNPRDLANALLDYRRKRDAAEAPKEAAEPEQESSQEEADAPETEPVEQATETTEPEEELPPIEPPRSWTKEEKEAFKSYPRDVQEKVSAEATRREAEFRRGQNELAEQKKAAAEELAKARDAATKYDQALPLLLQTLQDAQQGEFADIKSMADVEKLATEDWPRYAKWDAQQKKIAAVSQEVKAAQDRQAEQYKSQWAKFAADEDARFLEAAPEMADKERATKIADASVAMLKDIGFADADLAKLWNGEASLSLRDHRAQLLIRDAARYREAQKQATVKVSKPVPQVQKPGVARPRGADKAAEVLTLEQKLERSGSVKDAMALVLARRSARQ